MIFSIYTDGGCSGNKRGTNCPGAFAFLILDPGNNVLTSGSGRVENTTNNRMELTAAIKGMQMLISDLSKSEFKPVKNNDCVIYTDSRYMADNFSDYLPEWQKNGWRKSAGGMVINSDLWKELAVLTPEFKSFKFVWVKGHSIDRFNQEVDRLVRSQLYTPDGSVMSADKFQEFIEIVRRSIIPTI